MTMAGIGKNRLQSVDDLRSGGGQPPLLAAAAASNGFQVQRRTKTVHLGEVSEGIQILDDVFAIRSEGSSPGYRQRPRSTHRARNTDYSTMVVQSSPRRRYAGTAG